MHCGPRCKGHECRMKRHAKPAERLHDTEKILARVSLVEELQHRIIHGFDRTGHKETSCIAKSGQLLLIFEQMFDLNGHIVRHRRKYEKQLPALRDTGCLFVTSAVESV